MPSVQPPRPQNRSMPSGFTSPPLVCAERVCAPACPLVSVGRSATRPRSGLGFAALSCDQFLVGKTLAAHRHNHAIQPVHGVPLDVAVVEPEGELVDVAAKMLRAGMVVDAGNAALHDGPDRFDAVGVDIAARVLASAVVDRVVAEEQAVE